MVASQPIFNRDCGREVLYFAQEGCRTCGKPATHYLVTPLKSEQWLKQMQMQIHAQPFCNTCSPAVEYELAAETEKPSIWRVFWQRLLTH